MKRYRLPVSDRVMIPCFACGNPMTFIRGEKTRECLDCEVTELRFTDECNISRSGLFYGVLVEYIDHSRVYAPNP